MESRGSKVDSVEKDEQEHQQQQGDIDEPVFAIENPISMTPQSSVPGGRRKLAIYPFDPTKMEPNRTNLFVARPGCGKSTLMLDILFHQRQKYSHGIAMSATDEFTGFWSGCIPSTFVYPGYSKEATGKLVESQKKLFFEEYKKQLAVNPHTSKEDIHIPDVFCVDEDNAFGRDINSDTNVREIMMNGRHLHIGYYVAIQYLMNLHAGLRNVVAYIFILAEQGRSNRRKIHEAFFGCIPEFEDFCELMDWATSDHRCLVLDLTRHTNNYQECVFWYKATVRKPKDFRLGSPSFWAYHYAKQKTEEELIKEIGEEDDDNKREGDSDEDDDNVKRAKGSRCKIQLLERMPKTAPNPTTVPGGRGRGRGRGQGTG